MTCWNLVKLKCCLVLLLDVTKHNDDETLVYVFETWCRINKNGYERSVNKHLKLKKTSFEIIICLICDQGEQLIIIV